MSILKDLIAHRKQRIRQISERADKIMARVKYYQDIPLSEYPSITAKFKQELQDGKSEDDILDEAYALVSAASSKVLKMTPYKVQIIGGIILNSKTIAEMHTGEGKTLTATLPIYLNALSGKGAHLISVNSYLVNRDAQELAPLYNALGLTIGINDETKSIAEKKAAYAADITYTTNSELGFDYLRDNIATNKNTQVQRGFNYALIDEVDSVLLDNAQTPLIISKKSKSNVVAYQTADIFVRSLKSKDVIVEKDKHAVRLTRSGIKKAKRFYGKNLFINDNTNAKNNRMKIHTLMNALQAYFIYHNNEDYLVKDNQVTGIKTVELIDASTGRVLEGQRFADGIHQALEAKENVVIHSPNITTATITYQSLLQKYHKVAGMTGTAMTDAEELEAIYDLDVLPVPTNKPNHRIDLPDKVFATENEKYRAVAAKVLEYHDKKQPVLIGTTSVKNSDRLSKLLDLYGIKHVTLNAENPEKESNIIKHAGERGAITIATNMAGRGTDIKLADGVNELGGLVVLGTDRHETPRVDNQLRGRASRQGQNGVTQFYVSLEDDLFKKYIPKRLSHFDHKYHNYQGEINNKLVHHLFTEAQTEISEQNYERRKGDLTYERIISNERDLIYQERQQILDNHINYYKLLQQIIADTLQQIANKYKNHHISDEIITNIQQAVDDLFGKEQITVPTTINNLKDIIQAVKRDANKSLDERKQLLDDNFDKVLQPMILNILDYYWCKEISYLTDLKNMIILQSYQQVNPYVEYQKQATASYQAMLIKVKESILQLFMQLNINITSDNPQINLDIQSNKPKEVTI